MKIPKLIPILFLSLTLTFSPGCQTVKDITGLATTPLSEQSTEMLIVNAEKSADIGDDAMDTLLKLEYNHRASIMKISSKPHEYCEYLRGDANHNGTQDGLDAEVTLRTAIKSFKANRTADNRANLITAYNTIQDIIRDCKKYTATAIAASKK